MMIKRHFCLGVFFCSVLHVIFKHRINDWKNNKNIKENEKKTKKSNPKHLESQKKGSICLILNECWTSTAKKKILILATYELCKSFFFFVLSKKTKRKEILIVWVVNRTGEKRIERIPVLRRHTHTHPVVMMMMRI